MIIGASGHWLAYHKIKTLLKNDFFLFYGLITQFFTILI